MRITPGAQDLRGRLKILLLNQTFHPDVMATAQYLTELALALRERGHEVTVVSSRRGYDNQDIAFPSREYWRGVQILRVGSTRFGKQAKWRRGVDFASFLLSCCLRLVALPRQDVTVALTSPPLIAFLGANFARLRGGRFVYWIMDLNPDEAVAAGWLRPDSLAGKILERLSRYCLRKAASIIALDRFMRERIATKGVPPGKIEVIPPWSHDDVIHFDAAGRERFRQKHGLQERFVVMYSGNHSPCHPLTTLLYAARELKGEDFTFCFVGGGSEFSRVQAFVREHQLPNVLCLPYEPLTELSGSLSAADTHVVVMGNPFVGIIHPCKLYNILSVAAPVLYIGPEPSHVSEALASLPNPYPWVRAVHGDVAGVVRHLRRLKAESPGQARQPTASWAETFSKRALLPRLLRVITGLPAESNPSEMRLANQGGK